MDIISEIEFSGPIWKWVGPAPFYFVTIPDSQSKKLKAISKLVSYGWGMIPVSAKVGATEWKTSLFPQEDQYVLPLKKVVREAEGLSERDTVTVILKIG